MTFVFSAPPTNDLPAWLQAIGGLGALAATFLQLFIALRQAGRDRSARHDQTRMRIQREARLILRRTEDYARDETNVGAVALIRRASATDEDLRGAFAYLTTLTLADVGADAWPQVRTLMLAAGDLEPLLERDHAATLAEALFDKQTAAKAWDALDHATRDLYGRPFTT